MRNDQEVRVEALLVLTMYALKSCVLLQYVGPFRYELSDGQPS